MDRHEDPLRYLPPTTRMDSTTSSSSNHNPLLPTGFISIRAAAAAAVAFKEAREKQRQVAIFRKALLDFRRLKSLGELDPELEDNDIRLRGFESGTSPEAGGIIHTHPHLETFEDERARSLAQSNYDHIIHTLTTNYTLYEAWKALGFESNPFLLDPATTTTITTPTSPIKKSRKSKSKTPPTTTPKRIDLVTQGTRDEFDGLTPISERGTISFLIRDDMFLPWLEDHQTAIGCTFNKGSAAPIFFSYRNKMTAKRSWRFVCCCCKKDDGREIRKSLLKTRKYKLYGCKAKLTAYMGMTKPVVEDDGEGGGGGEGTADFTLVVYNFEHSHDLQQRDVDKDKENEALEDIVMRERMGQLSQHMKMLLLRGTSIQGAVRELGMDARRCRELLRVREQKFSRSNFLTRKDIIAVLRQLSGVGAEEELQEDEESRSTEQAVEELEVTIPQYKDHPSARRLSGLVAVTHMACVSPPIAESENTEVRIEERGHSTDSVELLRRYVDECDSSELAPCMDRVDALVDRLVAIKRLPDLPLAKGMQGVKRRKV